MSYQKNTLGAGQRWELWGAGNFFRLLTATGNVQVEFYKNGSQVLKVDSVGAGFWRESVVAFDRVAVTDVSGASNTIEAVVDTAHVGYDRLAISGGMSVIDQPRCAAATHTQATVTNSSAQILAANSSRGYLAIQNNDPAGNIFVRFDGAAATTTNGLKIPPGGYWESSPGFVPSGAIMAIGDIGSNANVQIVTG